MNLVADLGNTHIKIGVFQNNCILNQFRWSYKESIDQLNQLALSYPKINRAIISTVVSFDHPTIIHIKELFPSIELSTKTNIPISNKYKTPETLGKDRLCNAVGAAHEFINENCLIIDLGTCIKFDFINENQEYLGGAISPGLQMRYNSLKTDTDRLPLINKTSNTPLLGSNTSDSISSGVINGIIFEINGAIASYMSQFNKIKVVLTGGDHIHFVERIKNDTFARPNLTLIGLYQILKFNEVN
ncbi:MAG: type III pantothenate kinase [Salibacteraceae bacterium]